MIEAIITACIVGAISAAASGYVAFRILKATTTLEFTQIRRDLEDHEAKLGRVLYRDVCENCKGGAADRHSEVCRRLATLETSFRTCFDDLVSALRSKS